MNTEPIKYSQNEWSRMRRNIRRISGLRRPFNRNAIDVGEAILIHRLLLERKPARILEIGCHLYCSSSVFLGAMTNPLINTILYSVDVIHRRAEWNCKYKSANDRWLRVTSPSENYLERTNESFDFIFIDGDHHVNAVKSDLSLGIKRLCSGGVIVCHDICSEPLRNALLSVRPTGWTWHRDPASTTPSKGLGVIIPT